MLKVALKLQKLFLSEIQVTYFMKFHHFRLIKNLAEVVGHKINCLNRRMVSEFSKLIYNLLFLLNSRRIFSKFLKINPKGCQESVKFAESSFYINTHAGISSLNWNAHFSRLNSRKGSTCLKINKVILYIYTCKCTRYILSRSQD